MSRTALQVLIGTALVDQEFCEDLLNGKRPVILAEFDLTTAEREAALAVETDSIKGFAVGLCERLST
jgi:hypothetical protein